MTPLLIGLQLDIDTEKLKEWMNQEMGKGVLPLRPIEVLITIDGKSCEMSFTQFKERLLKQ